MIAARNAGELSQAQSNRLIHALRQQRLEARARVGREYKLGRITREELVARQRAIEERFEGPLAAAPGAAR